MLKRQDLKTKSLERMKKLYKNAVKMKRNHKKSSKHKVNYFAIN
ncbi:hypothetical protein G436_4738 [Leptospira interrogans serovar Hardjo str. Norma]|uniref:Uncharacterized protein n=1 Tax=Leptospira interrogans serovar Hardjo str. Norma TaxID=1279460 RepID=A0A0M3TN29_LEPIR|nr:hypothetical protein G436_4738 [Leptospira interrogans serovar Hardjo str. Norma]